MSERIFTFFLFSLIWLFGRRRCEHRVKYSMKRFTNQKGRKKSRERRETEEKKKCRQAVAGRKRKGR